MKKKVNFFFLLIGSVLIILFLFFTSKYLIDSRYLETYSNWYLQRKIENQISRMSIEEKIGQMIIVSVLGTTPDYYITKMIQERNIGGVILLGNNVVDAKQVMDFTTSLQSLVKDTNHKIPLFIAIDQEGGDVSRIKFDNANLVAQKDLVSSDEAYSVAKSRGDMLMDLGINMNFSPVIDFSNGSGFMKDRAFNTTVENQIILSNEMIRGYGDSGIISVPKHFLGYGSEKGDPHDESLSINDEEVGTQKRIWKEILPNCEIVMIGHMSSTETEMKPYSISKTTYTDLQENFNYSGLTITDDVNMGEITTNLNVVDASVLAVAAGVDIILTLNMPQEQAGIYNALVSAVKKGEITTKRIDNSVRKILLLKNHYVNYR